MQTRMIKSMSTKYMSNSNPKADPKSRHGERGGLGFSQLE